MFDRRVRVLSLSNWGETIETFHVVDGSARGAQELMEEIEEIEEEIWTDDDVDKPADVLMGPTDDIMDGAISGRQVRLRNFHTVDRFVLYDQSLSQ